MMPGAELLNSWGGGRSKKARGTVLEEALGDESTSPVPTCRGQGGSIIFPPVPVQHQAAGGIAAAGTNSRYIL